MLNFCEEPQAPRISDDSTLCLLQTGSRLRGSPLRPLRDGALQIPNATVRIWVSALDSSLFGTKLFLWQV